MGYFFKNSLKVFKKIKIYRLFNILRIVWAILQKISRKY